MLITPYVREAVELQRGRHACGLAEIGSLTDDATRTLLRAELPVNMANHEEVVDTIVRLSGSFPWFAVLLARSQVEEPGSITAATTESEAVAMAIGGPRPRDPTKVADWESLVALRKRAVFAVMLTDGIPWRHLDENQITKLEKIFEMPWSPIRDAACHCRERGIVRESGDWHYKYTTPNLIGVTVMKDLSFQMPWLTDKVRS